MSKEFKKLSYDTSVSLINNKYNINKEMFENSLVKENNNNEKYKTQSTKTISKTNKKEYYEYNFESKDNFYFHTEPVLNKINISMLDSILNKNYFKMSNFLINEFR